MQEIPVHLVPSAETLVMKPATAAFLPLAQLVMMAFSAHSMTRAMDKEPALVQLTPAKI